MIRKNINNKVHWGVIIENVGCIIKKKKSKNIKKGEKKKEVVKSFSQYNKQYIREFAYFLTRNFFRPKKE